MKPDIIFESLPATDPLHRVLVRIAQLCAVAMLGATGAMLWDTFPAICQFLEVEPPDATQVGYALIPAMALATFLFLYRDQLSAILRRSDD